MSAQPLGTHIHDALERFWASLDAIRHLDERLAPTAAALDEERLSPRALTAVASLSPERREQLKVWWESATPESADTTPAATALEPPPADQSPDDSEAAADTHAVSNRNDVSDRPADESRAGEKENVADEDARDQALKAPADDSPVAANATDHKNAAELTDILANRAVALEFVLHLRRSVGAPFRANLLRSSLFVTAFGAFEVLVGSLARAFYLAHPGALGDEPKFSLKDLQGLETLDDARDYAINGRVDSFLQESFEQWEKWFANYLKLTISDLCIDRAALEEMFQRRHIVVHNGGRVSRLYLQRLAGRSGLPELDHQLPITVGYLESALDELETLGTLLGAATQCKLFRPEQEQGINAIYQRSFNLMTQGRWRAVKKMCAYARSQNSSGSLREVFRANEWLACKRLDEFADVRPAVEQWDVSALHDRFQFARFVLLDDLDKAFPVAERLLKSGVLATQDFASWPMLHEFREDPRYVSLLDGDNGGNA